MSILSVGGGGNRVYIPSPCQAARKKLAANGTLNLTIGVLKVAGGIEATFASGGLLGALGAYSVGSGLVANIGGGLSQLAGAATGQVRQGEEAGNMFAAVGTVSGLVTLFSTKGNVEAAAAAAKIEGVATTPALMGAGAIPEIGHVLDSVNSARELVVTNPCHD